MQNCSCYTVSRLSCDPKSYYGGARWSFGVLHTSVTNEGRAANVVGVNFGELFQETIHKICCKEKCDASHLYKYSSQRCWSIDVLNYRDPQFYKHSSRLIDGSTLVYSAASTIPATGGAPAEKSVEVEEVPPIQPKSS